MADVTTETTTDTVPAVTPSELSGVLDLRPPKESVRAELCRLGLEFSSADGTAESWRDYQRGVLATFDVSEDVEDTLVPAFVIRRVRHVDGREDESRPHAHLGRA
mgnify:CR=1 FL=1